jgi:uncharacterized protein YndB with AHSA1/START domain
MIRKTIYIPVSRERLFSVLMAFDKYPEWTPGFERCTVLSTDGPATTVEMVVKGARRIRLEVRYDAQPCELLEFRMTGGNDVKTYSGLYRLAAAADGKGTVLFAELELEVSSMPRFLSDSFAKSSLDKAAIALKQYAGKLSPAGGESTPTEAVDIARRSPSRRARRLLQIARDPRGCRVWFMGETFTVKKIDGNVFDA